MAKTSNPHRTRPVFLLLYLLLLLSAACTPDEPAPTSTAAPTATITPQAQATIGRTRQPTPAPPSSTPTIPAVPTQTAVPLPLPTMTPFPTVTPDAVVYEAKPVFLYYGISSGDGAGLDDLPGLVIYGDGQVITIEAQGLMATFHEGWLTPAEMCDLRDQIEATGFTQPPDEHFTQTPDYILPASSLEIAIEDTFYWFHTPTIPYLVEELAQGIQLIQDYQPPEPLTTYTPTYLALEIMESEPYDGQTPLPWPADLPAIADLPPRDFLLISILEGEWVLPIYDLFSRQKDSQYFQDGEATYYMHVRPLLPHETPLTPRAIPRPTDYVPMLDCEGEPAFISPAG